MTDVYVYYFSSWDAGSGEDSVSARRGTLEAIVGRGDAIMESQIVVDHTELDDDGFLISSAGDDSAAKNDLTAQIRSIELRAASRDSEARKLNDTTEGKDKYLLNMESRELRNQARVLKNPPISALTDDTEYFGRLPTAE